MNLKKIWYAYRRIKNIKRIAGEGRQSGMVKWLQGKKTEIVVGLIFLFMYLGQPEIKFDPVSPELADQFIGLLTYALPVTLGARLKRVFKESQKRKE